MDPPLSLILMHKHTKMSKRVYGYPSDWRSGSDEFPARHDPQWEHAGGLRGHMDLMRVRKREKSRRRDACMKRCKRRSKSRRRCQKLCKIVHRK